MHIFLYGPPGSGKSTLGSALARALDLSFIDLDERIAAQAGRSIDAIFTADGEAAFRALEAAALREACAQPPALVALGGGALLDVQSRQRAERSGQVLLLDAGLETLLANLGSGAESRPLLAGSPETRLRDLLAQRAAHYDSFPLRLTISSTDIVNSVLQAQRILGAYRVRGMGEPYDLRFQPGGMDQLPAQLQARGLRGPVAVVSDSKVGPLYLKRTLEMLETSGLRVGGFCMPAGETQKNIHTLQQIWDFFIDCEIERGSTVIALGGGVVGDLAGFAAATFLRGVAWVNVPTSLLAMVDASLGGKTGMDLPQAKNLVGAFYPPRLVLADPIFLRSLPERELRGGLAEVLKHGVIGDDALFNLCEQGWQAVVMDLERAARLAVEVKLRVIEADPYEKHLRQVLNLGHTVGHGVELASEYKLTHGEAVAVGTAAEARLGESLGISEAGTAGRVTAALAGLGLPVRLPAGLNSARIVSAMRLDKKRAGGMLRFALPVKIGEVRPGVVVEDWPQAVQQVLRGMEGT